MTIAFVAIGAKQDGQVTIAQPYPASIAAGQLLVNFRCLWRPGNTVPSDLAGWTPAGQLDGGTGSATDDHATTIRGDVTEATGSETGTVTFSQTGLTNGSASDAAIGVMCSYSKGVGTWNIAFASGDQAAHTAGRNVTFGTALNVLAGDHIVVGMAIERDNPITPSAPGLTGTATFGSMVMRTVEAGGTALGRDGNIAVFDVDVTGPGTCTGFALTTTGNNCGPVVAIRLRAEGTIETAPTGIASTLAIGSPVTTTGSATATSPSGIASTRSTGSPVTVQTAGLIQRVVGANQKIIVKTQDSTTVRLKVGTDSGVTTGVFYTSPQTPDSQGRTTHDYGSLGLPAGQHYYYRVELNHPVGGVTLDAEVAVGEFDTLPVGIASYSVSFGSCTDYQFLSGGNLDSLALAAVAARDDLFFLHVGDFFYSDGTTPSLAAFRAAYASRLEAPAHKAVFGTRMSMYTPSDHDSGFSNDTNATSDAVAFGYMNAVWRETFPGNVPATTGVYESVLAGRALWIKTDCRSFKSPQGATDNSAKTMWGTTQKQWVKDQITNTTAKITFLIVDVPTVGVADPSDDSYQGYTTERAEMRAFLATITHTNVIIIEGDAHSIRYDDGSSANGFGVPALGASSFLTNASRKGGPYSSGFVPPNGTALQQNYGRITITDNITDIDVIFNAYDHTNTLRMTETFNYVTPYVDTTPTGTASTLTVGTPTTLQIARTTPTGIPSTLTIGEPYTADDVFGPGLYRLVAGEWVPAAAKQSAQGGIWV